LPSVQFYTKIGKLDKKLSLPLETILLIREQVARINVCLFCVDIGRSFAIRASINSRVFVPVTAGEEGQAMDPQYECCSARGAMAGQDAVEKGSASSKQKSR
jgi:hypothetical protein